MKKFLFSAAVVMSAMGIAIANSNSAKVPVDNKAYILNDTTPSDTTKPDSSFLLK
ncbi:hypothetical protein [Parafilimonas sp.]|uniref:hypothetical protein n=1 Tax=Parafilimonas sp. TaxID=1969739 RepID=UPI0039E6D468